MRHPENSASDRCGGVICPRRAITLIARVAQVLEPGCRRHKRSDVVRAGASCRCATPVQEPVPPPKSPSPQIPKSLSSASLRALRGEKTGQRRAITLIELLVVVTIMMLLAAYALPKMQPASEQRRIREAARMVSVFMSRAANRAKETGRPCGVMFQLLENPVISPTGGQSRAASNTLFEVEVPPAYAGLSTASRVSFVGYNAATGILRVQETISHDLWSDLISIGDKIQLNNQGPWYTVIGPDLVDNVTGSLPPDGLIDPPTSAPLLQELWLLVEPEHRNRVPSIPAAGVPFTVLRQPSQTIAPPLRLPRATVVDLGASGTNQQPVQFSSGDGDVMVLFSPNGSVSRYYYYPSGGTRQTVTPAEPLFFLVGREMQVGTTAAGNTNADDDRKANWQLPDNLWITVLPQTGLVAVTQNNEPTGYYTSGSPPTWPEEQGINEARTFAKQSRGMGGR